MSGNQRKVYEPPRVPSENTNRFYYRITYDNVFDAMFNTKGFTKRRCDVAYMVFCRLQDAINNTLKQYEHPLGVNLKKGESVFLTTYFNNSAQNIECWTRVMKTQLSAERKRHYVATALKDLEDFGLVCNVRQEYSKTLMAYVNVYVLRRGKMNEDEVLLNKMVDKFGIDRSEITNSDGTINRKVLNEKIDNL